MATQLSGDVMNCYIFKFNTYLCISNLLSVLEVNKAVCICLGRAPSAKANSCILLAMSSLPSYTLYTIMKFLGFELPQL